MPLGYLRRPAFLWLVSYLALLSILHAWGYLGIVPSDDLSRLAPRSSVAIEGSVVQSLRPGEFVLQAVSADGGPVSGRVLVHAPATVVPPAWGDVIGARGALRLPFPPETPATAGYGGYLSSRGIFSELDSPDGTSILRLGRPSPSFWGLAARLRGKMLGSFTLVPEPGASLLGAVLLGEKSLLPEGMVRAFRDAGAVHLLVAAGLHVGFVLLLASALARFAGASRVQSLVAGAAIGAVYVLCAGADSPLLRGYIMTVAGLAGFLLGRNSGAFQGLVLACWALAFAEPMAVFQAGFQMSFAAAFALVAAMPSWRPPAAWPVPLRYVAGLLLVSLAAQLALWPLSALYFHQFSAVAPLSNVVLIPMTAVLMAGGFGLFLLESCGLHFLAAVLAACVGVWAKWFLACVDFFSDLPLRWSVAAPSAGFLIVYGVLLLAAFALPDAALALRRCRWAVFTVAVVSIAGAFAPPRLSLAFCSDRGAATTVFLRAPDGARILVNAGAPGEALADSVLGSGSSSVDVLALGCLRAACWSGLSALSQAVRVKEVWAPPGPLDGDLARLKARLVSSGAAWRVVWPQEGVSRGGVLFLMGGGFTGGPQDDFPWTARWGDLETVVDERRGLSAVKNLCSIIKRPSSDAGESLAPRTLEGGPPLEIETDGRSTRILEPIETSPRRL